ncbi:hypothetical protein [Rhizohabitans arisaemae]|uniref:hypothetical protein n=1 Tax=Rhizohabitans arisaemae TaxID=2720610 RepID=UPI0024B24E8C|nr:hypothetical protein [Rhizohabitans arisaemae]
MSHITRILTAGTGTFAALAVSAVLASGAWAQAAPAGPAAAGCATAANPADCKRELGIVLTVGDRLEHTLQSICRPGTNIPLHRGGEFIGEVFRLWEAGSYPALPPSLAKDLRIVVHAALVQTGPTKNACDKTVRDAFQANALRVAIPVVLPHISEYVQWWQQNCVATADFFTKNEAALKAALERLARPVTR